MSPQPIDAHSLIGRMTAADRAQQRVERQPVVQQERLAVQTPAQSAQKETQVQDTDEAEHAPVRQKERKEPFSGRKRRRKKKPGGKSAAQEEVVSSDPATYNPRAGKEEPAADEGSVLDVEA